MNISAAELKHALKKLSPVKTETYVFDVDGIRAQDSDVLVVVPGPTFGGTFTVSGKKLAQVVNRMTGQIEISQFEKKLTLKSAKAVVDLEIQLVKSIPLPDGPACSLALSLTPFKKAMSIASASASPAKSAAFGGVVLLQNLPLGIEETISSGYRITGTDAVVLTAVTVETPVDLQFRALVNLTASAVVQLMDGETIEVGDTNKCLVLKSGGVSIYASKPVQKYPDFDGLMAKIPEIRVGFNPQELLSALKTVEPLIDETVDKGAVSLHFDSSVVKCSNIGVGSTASDESAYEQIEPDPVFDPREFNLKLTAKYLSGFLSRAGEQATLGVTDGPVRLESENVIVLTMPAKVGK
jgi:hypothetical protein